VGFISNIFKKKQKFTSPIDLSVLKTDLHSHLIPGIDDGAKDLEHSIMLIQELVEKIREGRFVFAPIFNIN